MIKVLPWDKKAPIEYKKLSLQTPNSLFFCTLVSDGSILDEMNVAMAMKGIVARSRTQTYHLNGFV